MGGPAMAFGLRKKVACTIGMSLVLAFLARPLPAEFITDVDAVTPGTQTALVLPAGVYPLFTVPIIYDTAIDGVVAGGWNTVGLDLSWGVTGGAGVLLTSPGMLAGTLPLAAPGFTHDLVPAGPVPTPGPALGPGSPLAPAGLIPPPIPGVVASLGGAAYYDIGTGPTVGAGTTFGGVTAGAGPLNVMGATFTISGAPGDTITFYPTGIIPPGMGGGSGQGGPFVSAAGVPFQFAPPPLAGGIPPMPGLPAVGSQTFVSGTITFIPEPSSLLMLGMVGLIALRSPRRRD